MNWPCLAILSSAILMLGPQNAHAQDPVAAFYKGKSIKVLVGSASGGGYDAYSRFVSTYMGKHIPGNPSLVVQNMPGGGGILVVNYTYNVAPKDGTVIAGIQRGAPMHQILGKEGAKFDSAKLNWLGSLNNEVTICTAMKKAKVQNLADLKKYELLAGSSGPGDPENVPAILNNLLGTRFKIVAGYPSTTAVSLAIERGEIDAICSSYNTQHTRNANWFKNNIVNILIQVSTRKHPNLPDVPLALEEAPNAEARALLELNDSRLEIGRPYIAPPNIPEDRLKALRKAFMDMTKDPAFIADVEKNKREVNPVSGEDIQKLIERIAKTDKAILAKLDDAMVYKGTKQMVKIDLVEFSGSITEVQSSGRTIVLTGKDGKTFKAAVSSSQTTINIAGNEAQRDALKAGQDCAVKAPAEGQTAITIDCK